jgi:hypothetical protein
VKLERWAISASILLTTCGGGSGGSTSGRITVALDVSADPVLTTHQPSVGIAKIRVTLTSDIRNGDATNDLTPDQMMTSFDKYPSDGAVTVKAEGLDALGNLVAYGEKLNATVSGDAMITIPFRRNLAFVTHCPDTLPGAMVDPQAVCGKQSNAGGASGTTPDNLIYVIDVATRTFVSEVNIPDHGSAHGISARGGDGILVAYEVNGKGKVAILSSKDLSWSTPIDLPHVPDLALAISGQGLGVAAGATGITYVDFDKGQVVQDFMGGGPVLDGVIGGDGKRALLALDADTSSVIIDFTDTCLKAPMDQMPQRCIQPQSVVPRAGCIGLRGDGRSAYIASKTTGDVGVLDLATGMGGTAFSMPFATPVHSCAWSEALFGLVAAEESNNCAGNLLSYIVALADCPMGTNCALGDPLGLDQAVPTERCPRVVKSDPSGHRLVAVEAGSSTASAGLTAIETVPMMAPVGSTGTYPADPKDTHMDPDGVVNHQRYQPRGLAILYGR